MKIYQINNLVTIRYSESHDSKIIGPNVWFIVDDELYAKSDVNYQFYSGFFLKPKEFHEKLDEFGLSDVVKIPIITFPNIKHDDYEIPASFCNYNPRMEVVNLDGVGGNASLLVTGLPHCMAWAECNLEDGTYSQASVYFKALSGFFSYGCGNTSGNAMQIHEPDGYMYYAYLPYEINIPVFPSTAVENGKIVGDKYKVLHIDDYRGGVDSHGFFVISISEEKTMSSDMISDLSSDDTNTSIFDPDNPSGENPNHNYTPNTENVGGAGSFDYSSDVNTFKLNKDIKLAGNSGFMKIYVPTDEQLQTIGERMRDENIFSTVATFFAGDISKAVIALNILPLDVPNDNTEHNLKIGWTNITASAPYATKQWIGFDCGTVEIPSFTKTEFDYSPNTQIQIYLPYVGVRDLDIDLVVGRKLNLVYNCDIVSGACIAILEDGETGRLYYQYTGNMAINVPITSRDFTDVFQSLIQTTTNVTVGAITGGGIGGVVGGAVGGAVDLLNTKPQVSHSGNVNTNYGYMSSAVPYVEIKTPSLSIASDENQYKGFPTNQTVTLSDCHGYTKVEEIHVENISATSNEQNEIVNLLTEGVLI